MLVKVEGVIIRAIKYGETSLIFDMYTAQYGVVSFIVNGARKAKSRLSASLFQLMNWLELIAYVKDPAGLNRVKEAQLLFHYSSISFEIPKSSIGLFMTEVVQKTIKENEANPELYDFLHHAYTSLDESTNPISNFHIVFLLQLTQYLGFLPNGRHSDESPYFHLMSGTFVHEAHPMYTLPPPLSDLISQFLDQDFEGAHTVALSKEMRKKVLNDILVFYRLHLEKFPEINTHKILAEVFS